MGDRGDLGGMIGEGPLEGGQEMLRLISAKAASRTASATASAAGLRQLGVAAVCRVSDITFPFFA